jgi:hypothetical protein
LNGTGQEVSTDHDHAPSKRLRDKHIKEMHHAAAKVLGSSANVTITPVHPLAKLCMLIAILLTHNALLGQQTGRARRRALLTLWSS